MKIMTYLIWIFEMIVKYNNYLILIMDFLERIENKIFPQLGEGRKRNKVVQAIKIR